MTKPKAKTSERVKDDPRATGRSLDLKKYAKLDAEKRDLKERLVQIDAELEKVMPLVISHFEKMGIDNTKIGGVTIYMKRELWAGKTEGTDGPVLAAALRSCGLEDLIRKEDANVQSLSAYVRDAVKNVAVEPDDLVQVLHEQLRTLVKVTETFKVATRKS